jgi:ATP-dependent Lon protease
VTNTIPERAVLKNYIDNIITAPYDRSTNKIKNIISIIKLAKD